VLEAIAVASSASITGRNSALEKRRYIPSGLAQSLTRAMTSSNHWIFYLRPTHISLWQQDLVLFTFGAGVDTATVLIPTLRKERS
jgi:hypothetical protein